MITRPRKTPQRAFRKEGGTYFDHNPFLRNSLIQQRTEAWVGGIFLVLGFLLQFLSYALRVPYGLLDLWVAVGILAGLFFLLLWISHQVSRRTITKLDVTELQRHIEECEQSYPDQIRHNLDHWGEQVKVRQLAGESDSDFLARIKSALADCPKYSDKLIP